VLSAKIAVARVHGAVKGCKRPIVLKNSISADAEKILAVLRHSQFFELRGY
jgi:hypothetical protein